MSFNLTYNFKVKNYATENFAVTRCILRPFPHDFCKEGLQFAAIIVLVEYGDNTCHKKNLAPSVGVVVACLISTSCTFKFYA